MIEPLSKIEIAVMEQLFLQGPIWDGDILSKQGRGDLVQRGYADRYEGYAFLTKSGMEIAVGGGMGEIKDKYLRRRAS